MLYIVSPYDGTVNQIVIFCGDYKTTMRRKTNNTGQIREYIHYNVFCDERVPIEEFDIVT